MQLVRPSSDYAQSYRAYIRELGDEVRYPFPLDFDHTDFPKLLRRPQDLQEGVRRQARIRSGGERGHTVQRYLIENPST